jgi:segregation and condensation protein A
VSPAVRDLDLDLDAFEGPFDLLLTLVLREELDLAEVDVVGIVLAFVDHHVRRRDARPDEIASPERGGLDLEASGEFLVLVAALLELKARELFGEESGLEDLDPEEAAEELAQRLAVYRRFKAAAAWLEERLEEESDRFFRLGPAPLAPAPAQDLQPEEPARLAALVRALAVPPPEPSLRHLVLTYPPVSLFLDRFRAVIARRRRFDFDEETRGLSRIEQTVAFLALLELRKTGEIALGQPAPFAPIAVWRAGPAEPVATLSAS